MRRWSRISGTPSSSENALAYCLQAVAETDEKVGIMNSHIAKMEEEIEYPFYETNMLANDLESKNGETDNFPSRNLSLQTPYPNPFS
jgi:hypothetical protein